MRCHTQHLQRIANSTDLREIKLFQERLNYKTLVCNSGYLIRRSLWLIHLGNGSLCKRIILKSSNCQKIVIPKNSLMVSSKLKLTFSPMEKLKIKKKLIYILFFFCKLGGVIIFFYKKTR